MEKAADRRRARGQFFPLARSFFLRADKRTSSLAMRS